MTDNLDSGSTTADSAGKPVTDGNAKPSSPPDYGERLERIEKMLASLQSGKDRAVSKVSKEADELRAQLGELQKHIKAGLSEDEALAKLEAEKNDAEFKKAVLDLRDRLVVQPVPEAFNPAKVVEELGLDYSDPAVAVAFEKVTNEQEANAVGAKLIRARNKKPVPSQAQAASQPANPVGTPDAETLARQFKQEMLAAPRGAAGNTARANIKEKYKKQGVDVYNVDFTV